MNSLENHTNRLANGKGEEQELPTYPQRCLNKSKKKVLSPTMFTKRNHNIKIEGTVTQNTYLFEQLLGLVAKCYYKSSFEVENWIKDLQTIPLPNMKPLESPPNKKIQKSKNSSKNRSKNGNANASRPKRSDSKDEKGFLKEFSGDGQKQFFDRNNILDYLVSPLKIDQIYGILKRGLVDEGHRDFRKLHLRLRQAV